MSDGNKIKKDNKEGTLAKYVVIFIILFIICGIIIFYYFTSNGIIPSNSAPDVLKLPLVTTHNTSSSTGEVVEVNVNIAFGGSEKALDEVEDLEYFDIVEDTIGALDYDVIAADDGLDTIKNSVENEINQNLEDNEIDKVYIYGIDIGVTNTEGLINDNNSEEDVLEGIFQEW